MGFKIPSFRWSMGEHCMRLAQWGWPLIHGGSQKLDIMTLIVDTGKHISSIWPTSSMRSTQVDEIWNNIVILGVKVTKVTIITSTVRETFLNHLSLRDVPSSSFRIC